jgi:two-component system, OmpR family, response regulator
MKLLVVEDDAKIAGALRRGLTAEGFQVEIAQDGVDGLWRAREGSYDLILLDVMLPGHNGYRVCADLRRAGDTTPILMLTAKDGELDEAEGLDTGADDYLRKPFSFAVLVARCRALVRRGGRGGWSELVVGDLVLDPARRVARRGEVSIHLSRRETSLLEYLMRSRGSVRSRDEILEQVWGDLDEAGTNLVEVYVGYLRKKLDQPFGTHSLRTVRGQGYQLDDP